MTEENALESLGFLTCKADEIDKKKPAQALLDGDTILVTGYEVPLSPGSLREKPIVTNVVVIPLLSMAACKGDFRMTQMSFIITEGMNLTLSQDSGANSQP